MALEPAKKNIVIVGGGIIGCTTAYFLTRHSSYNPAIHKITILEATSLASGASGKAGGLLALWAYPASIVPLSYKLHAELAKEHDGAKRWGYRAIDCAAIEAKGQEHAQTTGANLKEGGEWNKLPKMKVDVGAVARGVPKDLDWIDQSTIRSYSSMGTPSTTAQVHPYQFTTSMASLAVEAGAEVILGSVSSIDHADGIKSITYTDKLTNEKHTIPATEIILCAGPWTSKIFPAAPIESLRAHSVVIEAEVAPYAIFSEISLPGKKGRTVSPEMYARPDGTVYACGEGDTLAPLPATTDLAAISPSHISSLTHWVSTISTPLRTGKVLAQQACYLPSVTNGNGPLIGPTSIKGLYIATGHTCWGIQNSCATGLLMSEFIFDGEAKSASVGSLDPRKFM